MDFLLSIYCGVGAICTGWWPWFSSFDEIWLIQFFICCTLFYVFFYNNIYYLLLYTFINFFLVGVYLALLQVELFTAFLWLVECSVLFVFLLLLFFLNIKGVYAYTLSYTYTYLFLTCWFLYVCLLCGFCETDSLGIFNNTYAIVDNYYESLANGINNDLIGFSLSYYTINSIEFILVGFLLLVGSVVCVNLYCIDKSVRNQNFTTFLSVFNFFLDFSSFSFLRRQNLIKQGNVKPALKLFKKI